MDIQAEKLNIIQWLAGINDGNVILKIKELKKSNEEILAISIEEKVAIDKGLKSIEEGRFKTHEEVVHATKKKYSQVFK